MVTQLVEFGAPAGQTVTARLFLAGSDNVVQTASTVTAKVNDSGDYTATFANVPAGTYRLKATNAAGTVLARWWVDVTLTAATFQAYELPRAGFGTTLLESRLTENRAAALDAVILAENPNTRTVKITGSGSGHIAADVHQLQPDVITADSIAADAVTELQSGLALQQTQLAIKAVTDKLNSGLVDDGLVWQFTANMLELGPSSLGGDATSANQLQILEQLDVIQGKTDLLNPAPTGSVLLVDSGEYYCTRQDVELVFGMTSVITWADVDNTGNMDFIDDRVTTMIALAHEQTNDALRQGGYALPFAAPRPASLTYNVAALAGVLLYESRGAIDSDSEDGTHRLSSFRKRWEKYIKQLLSQQVRLDATRQNATTAPAVY